MAWPDFESLLPPPMRGGPIPPDLAARTRSQLRDAWRRYVARRVHGAEERALALVVLPRDGDPSLPFAMIFDGRGIEAASPVLDGADAARAVAGLPRSGMVMRQGGVVVWRESLSSDQAAARWRQLGGDDAFALPPPQPSGQVLPDAPRAYALIRRGGDHAHVELAPADLGAPQNAPLRTWAARLGPWLPEHLRPHFR